MDTPYVDYSCYLFTNFAIALHTLFPKSGRPETTGNWSNLENYPGKESWMG